jgi:hypothetical protein
VSRSQQVERHGRTWLVDGEQTEEIFQRRPNVCLGVLVMPFDGDEGLGRRVTRRGLVALTPTPTTGTDQAGLVDEDDLT